MALKEEYEDQVTFVIVDVETADGNALANDFGVRYIPAFFYVDSSGGVVAEDVGRLSKSALEQNINKILP
ncbi:thioredoxin-like negative regulator of GroEL [Desulfitispora alkaliphila]